MRRIDQPLSVRAAQTGVQVYALGVYINFGTHRNHRSTRKIPAIQQYEHSQSHRTTAVIASLHNEQYDGFCAVSPRRHGCCRKVCGGLHHAAGSAAYAAFGELAELFWQGGLVRPADEIHPGRGEP